MIYFPGKKLKTYEFQSYHPKLPVPSLKSTCKKYLASVRPILSDEEYQNTKQAVDDFMSWRGPGWKLQLYLLFRSLKTANWLDEWWEKYAYLRNRSPLPGYSNYSVLSSLSGPNVTALERAAYYAHSFATFSVLVKHENLAPAMIRDAVPLDMSGFKKLFGSNRVPGEEMDTISYHPTSRHVVVMCKTRLFAFDVVDRAGRALPYLAIREQFTRIHKLAQELLDKDGPAPAVSAVTGADRTTWARTRTALSEICVENKRALQRIESAMFMVCLDDDAPADMSQLAHSMMFGNGTNRWFDKSLCVIVTANGLIGQNNEHTPVDGSVLGLVCEYTGILEPGVGQPHLSYPTGELDDEEKELLPSPCMVKFEVTKAITATVAAAQKSLSAIANDFEHAPILYQKFGKGVPKAAGMSPDGFLQMAFQLAFYRDQKSIPNTYESCSSRLFLLGRTDTIRPVSESSRAFVMTMDADIPSDIKRKHLEQAIQHHSHYAKAAFMGQGVDRHLFGLYLISIGMGMKVKLFEDKGFSVPFRLSTSQVPHIQRPEWGGVPKYDGGGFTFGAVCKDGYGIGYVLAGEDTIYFHISSWKSSGVTSATRFAQQLEKALQDMRDLVTSTAPSSKSGKAIAATLKPSAGSQAPQDSSSASAGSTSTTSVLQSSGESKKAQKKAKQEKYKH